MFEIAYFFISNLKCFRGMKFEDITSPSSLITIHFFTLTGRLFQICGPIKLIDCLDFIENVVEERKVVWLRVCTFITRRWFVKILEIDLGASPRCNRCISLAISTLKLWFGEWWQMMQWRWVFRNSAVTGNGDYAPLAQGGLGPRLYSDRQLIFTSFVWPQG